MLTTYDQYLKTSKSLTIEEMLRLYDDMVQEIGTDEDALDLYEDLLEAAVRYAHFRAKWCFIPRVKKGDIGGDRTSSHKSVITNSNSLAKYLRMRGKEASWRDTLGYEEDDPLNRKRIGDFACFLVFIDSLNAR